MTKRPTEKRRNEPKTLEYSLPLSLAADTIHPPRCDMILCSVPARISGLPFRKVPISMPCS
jgi:hypothetical protein